MASAREVLDAADARYKPPILGRAESLNAAAAAGIMLVRPGARGAPNLRGKRYDLKVLGCDGAYPQVNGPARAICWSRGSSGDFGLRHRRTGAAASGRAAAALGCAGAKPPARGPYVRRTGAAPRVAGAKSPGLLPAAHKMDLYLPASPARGHALLADEGLL